MLLLITAVSTTFAWFSLNDAAWVDDFELELHNSDKLLIRHESGQFKQMLIEEDIVAAINSERESEKITSISDISFSEVYSIDGVSFNQLVPKYDDMNRKTVSLEKASENSYLRFKLYFRIEQGNENEGQLHPDYYLILSNSDNEEGVKKTSFTAKDQAIKLVNSLVTTENEFKMDDSLSVNPINALKLAIKGDSNAASSNPEVDYIYDLADELDLGSYAIDDRILNELEITDSRFSSSKNAGFTYYNNINNHILNPIGYYEDDNELEENVEIVNNLLSKIRYDFSDSLGKFEYDEQTKQYNEVGITISIWLEGFDADNLIGLDSSVIKCLLSFKLVEGGSLSAIYS